MRQNGFDKNIQRASADQAGIVLGILIQIEGERARLFAGHDFARGLPHLGLNTAAADGAGNGAVVAHQHFRALERRDGTAHVDDGGHGSLVARALQLARSLRRYPSNSIIGFEDGKSNGEGCGPSFKSGSAVLVDPSGAVRGGFLLIKIHLASSLRDRATVEPHWITAHVINSCYFKDSDKFQAELGNYESVGAVT